MKLFLVSLVAVLAVGFFLLPTSAQATTTTISTCAQLQAIPADTTSTYQLINDITCSNSSSFTPISNFGGVFDGDGFTINNFSIFTGINGRGLFGTVDGATIRNLKMTNAQVYGNFQVGILAAVVNNSTITNVNIQGLVSSGALISIMGGVVGQLTSSTVTGVTSNVTISSGYSIVGGLIGAMHGSSTISRSFSTGTISIVKNGSESTLGGLVGLSTSGTISNSFSHVNVTATGDNVGGLVGSLTSPAVVDKSYSKGSVSTPSAVVGGLVGVTTTGAIVTDSYWDVTRSGQASSKGGTGTTTLAMQTQATYAGWDFASIWSFTTGTYPLLQYFDITPPTMPGVPTSTSPTTNTTPTVTWSVTPDGGEFPLMPYLVQWSTSSVFAGTVFSSSTGLTSLTVTSSLPDGTWYFRVRIRDSAGNTSAFATSSAILIDNVAPALTLLGDAEMTITNGETFIDPGVSALDAASGNIAGRVTTSGTVNAAINGTYTVVYNVTDPAGNAASPSVSRSVTVRSAAVVGVAAGGGTPAPSPSGGTPPQPTPAPSQSAPIPSPVVSFPASAPLEPIFPASTPTTGMRSAYIFTRNLRFGMRGTDVRELQKFLNTRGFLVATEGPGSPGQETTYFGDGTYRAVLLLQERYPEKILAPLGLARGTGLFLENTRRFINENTF